MAKAKLFEMVTKFVTEKIPVTEAAKAAMKKALGSVAFETDSFVRSGNFTAWTVDEQARSSARIEPLVDDAGKYALTYSTMEGRRVDDVIWAILDHVSLFLYPPTPRGDLGKDGKPKMQSHRKERDNWIQSLGFTRAEVGRLKRTLFGDAFADLKTALEDAIPQHFAGTAKPTTAKSLLALIAPARLSSETIRVNVYKTDAPAEKRILSVNVVVLFLLDGFTFQRDEQGVATGDLAQYYDTEASRVIHEMAEKAKADKAKADAAAA